jgi:hypothetical protein
VKKASKKWTNLTILTTKLPMIWTVMKANSLMTSQN